MKVMKERKGGTRWKMCKLIIGEVAGRIWRGVRIRKKRYKEKKKVGRIIRNGFCLVRETSRIQ